MVHVLLRLLLVVALGAACATTKERAPADPSLPAGEQGRIIYETSCCRCHALFSPSSYRAEDWVFFVRKYGRKARLSAEERDLVTAYLGARARP